MKLRVLGRPVLTTELKSHELRPVEAFLLAYLSLHANASTRAELAWLLWPDAQRPKALHSLSQLLYSLKKRYNVHCTATAHALRVPALETDLHIAKRLMDMGRYADAVELFTGRFLAGAEAPSEALNAWRDDMESQSNELLRTAISRTLQDCDDADLPRIANACDLALSHHPHFDGEKELLIRVMARIGELSRARRLYAELVSTPDSGNIPSFEQLVAPVDSSCSTKAVPPPTDAPAVAFVGREEELRTLISDWREVQTGSGCTRILWGEPGIGKTRLAIQLLRRIAISGGETWLMRCTAGTQRLPFHGIRTLLEDNLRETASNTALTFLLQPASATLADHAPSDHVKHLLVNSVTEVVIARAVQKPLAILVDDAQWADDFTSLLLAYWSYRLKASRVYLIYTARTHDYGAPPGWLMNEVAGARHLTVRGLTTSEVQALVSSFEQKHTCTIPDEARATVAQQCGGIPYLVLEQLAATAARDSYPLIRPPESAEALLTRRFRELPSNCEWLVGLVTVLNRPVTATEIVTLSGMRDSEASAALDLLQNRGILVWANAAVTFPHDLMRETAYRQLREGTRALLHHRVATLLEAGGGPDGVIAQHYAAAGDCPKCVRFAKLAADTALARHLYSDAEFYLQLALSHASSGDVPSIAQDLLRLLLQVGRIPDAEKLLAMIPSAGEDDTTAMLRAVATLEQELGRGATTTDLVRRGHAVSRMTQAMRASGLATIGATLLNLAMDAGAHDLGREVTEALEREARRSTDPEFVLQAQAVAAIWDTITRSAELGKRRMNQVGWSWDSKISAPTIGLLASAEAIIAFYTGDLRRAVGILDRAIRHAEGAGDLRRLAVLQINWAVACMEVGDIDKARHAMEMTATSPKLPLRIRAYQNLSLLHFERSDYVLSEQAADAVLVHNQVYEAPAVAASAHAVKGLCALSRGSIDEARKCLRLLQGTNVDYNNAMNDMTYIILFVARMAAVEGDAERALQVLRAAIDVRRPMDAICGLRLECEVAHIMTQVDADAAYALAKRVEAACIENGAALIAAQARQVLSICRLCG